MKVLQLSAISAWYGMAMLASLSPTMAHAVPPVKFASPVPYGALNASDVAVNDFDGDGKMDFASVTRLPNLMSVFTNSGNGSFGISSNYALPNQPFSIAAGDLNGDGKPDIVATWRGVISVFTNVNNATFAPAIDYGIFTNNALILSSVSLGDFNGDHKLDIAVGILGSNVVTVLLNNGNGTFGSPTNFPTHSTANMGPITITLADLNNDGILDIVTANGSGGDSISVLLGNGDGSFSFGTNYSTKGYPICAVVGDFNNDGKPDIAATNPGENSIGLLFGNGDGTFGTAITTQVLADPRPMAAGDLNGDGNLDLVMVHNSITSTSARGILLGKGDGSFLAETNAFAPPPVNRIIVADVNGDNQPDLLIAASSGVSIYLNQSVPTLKGDYQTGRLVLQWPNWAGYILETATMLPTDTWIAVTDTPALVNNQNSLTNFVTGSNQFFRLNHH
ncbi:FG-GAP repeat domain-containing protein [Pedosphaera parvula]|nr:VCBS repeat-containing protein [Pedosphaera parvula]